MKIGNKNSRVKANFPFLSVTTDRFWPPPPTPRSSIINSYVYVHTPALCVAFVGQYSRGKHTIQEENVELRPGECMMCTVPVVLFVLFCLFDQSWVTCKAVWLISTTRRPQRVLLPIFHSVLQRERFWFVIWYQRTNTPFNLSIHVSTCIKCVILWALVVCQGVI